MTECSVPVTIEKPRLPEHGDLACGTALKLAGAARTAPIKIAETVAQYIEQNPKANHEFISHLNAAAPGFINFHLGTGWLKETLMHIVQQGDNYGRVDLGQGQKV